MAVEKSYARLGLFLVVGLVVVLATALFFIQRLRSREVITAVTYTRENVSGLEVSSPVRYRGVSVGRIADVRVDPRSNSIEVDFEVFLDRLVTIGANVERVQAAASWRHIRKTSSPDSAQSRNGRGVLVARSAGRRPATDLARVHTGSGICAVDAHDAFEGRGSAAGASGARSSDPTDPQGDYRQGSRYSRPERPIFHQHRKNSSGEPDPGAERRFAEIPHDNKRTASADRADHVRIEAG